MKKLNNNYVVAPITIRLRELVKDKYELAEVIGCCDAAAGNYLNGNRIPPTSTLVTIAKHYKVTTDYLLGVASKNSVVETADKKCGIDEDVYAVLGLFFAAYTGLPEDVVNLLVENKPKANKTAAVLRSLLTEV